MGLWFYMQAEAFIASRGEQKALQEASPKGGIVATTHAGLEGVAIHVGGVLH